MLDQPKKMTWEAPPGIAIVMGFMSFFLLAYVIVFSFLLYRYGNVKKRLIAFNKFVAEEGGLVSLVSLLEHYGFTMEDKPSKSDIAWLIVHPELGEMSRSRK